MTDSSSNEDKEYNLIPVMGRKQRKCSVVNGLDQHYFVYILNWNKSIEC
jgi:hypothetical protein